jgi:predicted TIM-barrel fold metal-dependent hydrolase
MPHELDRRQFLTLLGSAAAGLALPACGQVIEPGRYTEGDIALLAAHYETEEARSGKGPFGVQRYRGYRGLAELPWFEIDRAGTLRCVDDNVPLAIDFHCHFGMSVLFEPDLDLHAETNRVMHLLDCDAEEPGCDLDLDVYVNANFTPDELDTLRNQTIAQGLFGSRFAETQTIPNLLREMDATRVEQAIILPIALGLPFGDNLTERWREAIDEAAVGERLHAGLSVHPRSSDRLERMKAFAQTGARVLKLHPTVQRFFPDDPDMMEIYALAEELGLVIFFHGGRAGIEPESSHPFAMPRHYEAALANFPNLRFVLGHAGARDAVAMLELALRYENTWLGIHGQSVTHLDEMIRRTEGERLLFGTDWPFYHLASSLAKVLIATRDPGRNEIRTAILRDNALDLLG